MAKERSTARSLSPNPYALLQIRHIEIDMNFLPTDAAYDIALYAEFTNEKDLEIYQKHPEHLKAADFAGKVQEQRVAVNYKILLQPSLRKENHMPRTITTRDLKTLLETRKDVTLLDVRRKADYDADREAVAGAAWRDPEKVEEWSRDLPKDKDVVIYCARGGSVSNKVLDSLLDKKLPARYVEGGIAAWKEAGGKTEDK